METSSKKNVLLVEDEAVIALCESRVLERNGYAVRLARDGEAAIAAAADPAVDVVLMDIDLGPGIDGTEAARAILEARDVPIVFLSSHTEPEVVEKTEGITSYGYIVKNSGDTVLLASLKMAFRLFESRRREREKEEALIEHGNRLRSILSAAPIGIGVVVRRVIQSVNTRLCAMTGYGPEELVGRCAELLYESREEFERVGAVKYRQIAESGTGSAETRWRRKDGSVIDVLLSSSPINKADLDCGVTFTALDIGEQKRAEREHARHVALESVVIAMAARFLEYEGAVPDAELRRALRELGEFSSVDRSYVFLFDESLATMSSVLEWCAPGVEPQHDRLQGCQVAEAPWWLDELLSKGEIVIPRVEAMPPEARAEKAVLEAQSIRSLLTVAFKIEGRLAGYLGFDAVAGRRDWSEEELALIKMAAAVFGAALSKSALQTQLVG
jgi:PAS domain S-box-containing protein